MYGIASFFLYEGGDYTVHDNEVYTEMNVFVKIFSDIT